MFIFQIYFYNEFTYQNTEITVTADGVAQAVNKAKAEFPDADDYKYTFERVVLTEGEDEEARKKNNELLAFLIEKCTEFDNADTARTFFETTGKSLIDGIRRSVRGKRA